MSQQVWLARHGETEWSRTGKHTGHSDIPLTDKGEAQARRLAELLEGRTFALVLTSALERAWRTAELAGFGGQIEKTGDLCEWNYGEYEGVTTPEIRKTVPGWTVWTHPTPGGETAEQVGARCDKVIDRISGVDGDVALFAHGHVLRVFAARWLGLEPNAGRLFKLDTATVSVLGYERETRVIEHWNERTGV